MLCNKNIVTNGFVNMPTYTRITETNHGKD